MHGQLPVEVTLLGGVTHLEDGGGGHHDGDDKEPHAVDNHFQVGVVRWSVVGDC